MRLLPMQYVRPYGCRNKTDRHRCAAEAARCGETRPVPVKTVKPTRILADTREESIYAAFIVTYLATQPEFSS